MNYTSNHHLPQWVSSDRVRMEDFNAAMANIDSGMSANASAASRAQSTASSAQSAANAAYSPDNKPYVTGTYTGQSSNQVITLGFMPSFLIVTGMSPSFDKDDTTIFDRYFALVGSNGTSLNGQLKYRLQLLQDGFAVYKAGNNGAQLPDLDDPGRTYYYIAFR